MMISGDGGLEADRRSAFSCNLLHFVKSSYASGVFRVFREIRGSFFSGSQSVLNISPNS